MNWSIILSIAGIVVSVVVGWLTYRLADRRARNQRHTVAKNAVLQDLSNSLGEDSIPNPVIIEATIRSVLRQIADPKIDLATDEVLDDLIRQVTSDPFLDPERRRKLQSDIERVREEASHRRAVDREYLDYDWMYRSSRVWPMVIGILATVLMLVSIGAFILNHSTSNTSVRSMIEIVGSIFVTVVIIFLAVSLFKEELPLTFRKFWRDRGKR